MLKWGEVGLSDGVSVFEEGVVQFNDYIMVMSLFVFWFVMLLVLVEVVLKTGGDREGGGGLILEAVWTLLPMLVLVFMAYPSLVLLYVGESFSGYSYQVLVVGRQWYWDYVVNGAVDCSYMVGEGGSGYRVLDVDNRLVVPAFMGVEVLCTSGDVIHSWAVPSLGVKVDCVPGRLNRVELEILGGGVFYGQCSELCGVMHSFMPIVVEVIPASALMGV
uniref:Cytochrome c oxidase subunit 2 n=1 Tax=Pomphorhynchus tereticollis TaxID=255491 RepID=A0A806GMC3_9BILA|nr:cytochrome c oxidase subunit II [Pomphorhynchus tereticollis]AFJ14769.1 cytochrome c oxidase subunit II [Pomphorhynchus tereticollis]